MLIVCKGSCRDRVFTEWRRHSSVHYLDKTRLKNDLRRVFFHHFAVFPSLPIEPMNFIKSDNSVLNLQMKCLNIFICFSAIIIEYKHLFLTFPLMLCFYCSIFIFSFVWRHSLCYIITVTWPYWRLMSKKCKCILVVDFNYFFFQTNLICEY